MYAQRFDEVLEFHEPGLAPVRQNGKAWHIRPDGTAVYGRRFLRTFGYYEGLAAVCDADGWHHIRPDGTDLYALRYAWCGNFQEGRCAVRDQDGSYFHLGSDGAPTYAGRWRYAGDFREGFAVVQSSDGRSTHIGLDGKLTHHQWFLDLDVFHKGFARARDYEGWTHIDIDGLPAYGRRFAAIEPFYNGQARVERFDGALEVIDESGQRVVELRPPLRSEFASLSSDMVGFWRTQTIQAAVELGVFEALPATSEALARTCGLALRRVPRLLRALRELRLIRPVGDEWQMTERGRYLQSAHPLTLAGAATEYGRYLTHMWKRLPDALRAGASWQAPDIFSEVAADASRIERHHRMLMSYARHDYVAVPAALSLQGDERVVDAGGGIGVLVAMLLECYPTLHVTLLDRPEVIERARRRQFNQHIELRAGDLFRRWGLEADVVVMARVLHDWDDRKAIEILRQARAVLQPGGRLFIVEMILTDAGKAGGLCDLHLLMANGGRERTAHEFALLMSEAGFSLKRVHHTPAVTSVIEGVAQ